MFNPFGAQSSYPQPQFPFAQGSFQAAYQGTRQQQRGGGQATAVGSTTFFQGSDSRADESSPVGSASPVSQEQLRQEDPVDTVEWSESSPEEGPVLYSRLVEPSRHGTDKATSRD